MYPCYRDRIEAERQEEFPLPWIVAENLLHLSTWLVAGSLLWPIRVLGWPLAAIAWAALVVFVQILLKKHNCSGCYYYGKSCHLGWGRLSAWLFKQDSGDEKTGERLSLFYVLSPPIILVAAILVGIFIGGGAPHWALLGAYVALNAVTFPVRSSGCARCAMRSACAGSAAKKSPRS
jgi:hypothetical protein